MTTAALSADDLNRRVLTVEALDREAFNISGSSTLGTAYLLGSLEALVSEDVWRAAVASAELALHADRERQAAAR